MPNIEEILSYCNCGGSGVSAWKFFYTQTPNTFALLILVVFVMGVIRSFFAPEQTRRLLSGKRGPIGNILASMLGIVTPFCSCSAVPMFIGFITAGVPLGLTFSFLVAAPLINEIAVALLFGLLGWKITALYVSTGFCIAVVSGWLIGRLRLEKHVEEWVFQAQTRQDNAVESKADWATRFRFGWQAVKSIVGKIWLYVLAGLAIGSVIHGYVPRDFLEQIMDKEAGWWGVPVAVIIGIPMYANPAGIVPIVQALLDKGAALGTVLSFMMAVIALSLPEMIILRKVLKPRLIVVFIGIVGTGILFVGYLFNLLY